MLRQLLLWATILVGACAKDCPHICALSPTPNLLYVERGENFTTKIVRKDSGAFISVNHGPEAEGQFGMFITAVWPSRSIKLMPWGVRDSLSDSGWVLALMPSSSATASFSSPDGWLQETGFAGQEEEHFGSWLDLRSGNDPFAAVVISCATRSEEAGNVAYTCAGTKEK